MTDKTILLSVLTYEGKKYCQKDFFERLFALEAPEGYRVDPLIVVNTDNMIIHGEYYREICEYLKENHFPAIVSQTDLPYPYGNQTRLTYFYNVIRGVRNVARYDYVFNVESDVLLEPWHLKALVEVMEDHPEAGMVGGVTEYEDVESGTGDNHGVMVYKKLPLDETALRHVKYPLPVVIGDRAGWVTIEVPVIREDGQITNCYSYTHGEMKKMKGARVVDGVVLGCTLIRGEILDEIPFRFNPHLRTHTDYTFNIDVRKAGWKIMVDPEVWPRHWSKPWNTPGGHMFPEPVKEPSLTIIIPTHDPARPLKRCLTSIKKQIGPDDEVIVVIDTHGMTDLIKLMAIDHCVENFGEQFRTIKHDAGHHCYGHCQMNIGLKNAKKEWIVAQDDDDIFAQGAFKAIRDAIKNLPENVPLMFKFQPYIQETPLWDEQVLAEGKVGGHCLVAPNDEKMGRFTCRYCGDFDWVIDTIQKWDMKFRWVNHVISIARPTKPEHDPEKW
ncbi:Glycosyl transferase family 2 [uncultured archaeon]|nr:Glycosyl transferase family 2 [uncultured archaeon]